MSGTVIQTALSSGHSSYYKLGEWQEIIDL